MEGSEDFALLSLARDRVAALKRAGRDAAALETALETGIRRVLAMSAGGSFWGVNRDRAVVDDVRVRILRLLEKREKGRTVKGTFR